MKKLIVHVAEIEVSEESGMGRVAWHWQNEFVRRGYDFLHIGPQQVGGVSHLAFFPDAARRFYHQLGRQASILIVHEPAAGAFINLNIPTVLVSHGIERRGWNLHLKGKYGSSQKLKWRTKLLFPLWRLRYCDSGLRRANLLLLLNQEDCEFVQNYYHRELQDIFVFKNGVYPFKLKLNEKSELEAIPTILFTGCWIERKGVKTLVDAAEILHRRGLHPNWLMAGTVFDQTTVLNSWPNYLHPYLEIIPKFVAADEVNLLARSQIFVLPSFFEGQSLALLQAMASGKCCITTNCCGQKDLISHQHNGLLYEPGDAEELAALIENCLQDFELRLKLGKNAQTSVQNRSWEDVSMEVVDRIEMLLS